MIIRRYHFKIRSPEFIVKMGVLYRRLHTLLLCTVITLFKQFAYHLSGGDIDERVEM